MKPLQNVGGSFSFTVALADANRTSGANKALNGSPVVHHRWQSKRVSDVLQMSVVAQNQVSVSEGDWTAVAVKIPAVGKLAGSLFSAFIQ